MEKRIFIGGPHRSGTTLMMYILNNHPSIGILPETSLFEIYDNEKDDIIRLKNIIPFRRDLIKNQVFKDPKNFILDPKKYVNFLQKGVAEWQTYDKDRVIKTGYITGACDLDFPTDGSYSREALEKPNTSKNDKNDGWDTSIWT